MDFKDRNKRLTYHIGQLSFLTAISRILGLIREIVFAYFFGASMATDSFFVAFRLPNLLRRLFAEGAMTISFIPVFSKYLRKYGEDEAKEFANSSFTYLTLLLFFVTIIGIVFAHGFVFMTAPGFSKIPEKFQLTVNLTRLTFPFIFSVGLVSLFSGILNSHNHFFTPALAPIILNLSIIAGTFAFYSTFSQPVYSIAIGVLIGSVLQLLIQIPPLLRLGYKLEFKVTHLHNGVKEAAALFFPATFGAAVYQINLLVTTFLASFLPEGAVAYLWYAGRFFELPLGVFAVSVAVVSLPNLSLLATENRMDEWKSSLNYVLSLVFFISLPAMFGLMVLVEPLIRIFYQMGKFSATDTVNTASALFYYATGLWAVGGSRIVVQAFYSLHDTKTPVKIAALTFILNVILSISLMFPMKHNGLALATSLASQGNFAFLIIALRRRVGRLGFSGVLRSIAKSFISSIVMASLLFYLVRFFSPYFVNRWISALIVIFLSLVGILIFTFVSFLLKSKELHTVFETYFKKSR